MSQTHSVPSDSGTLSPYPWYIHLVGGYALTGLFSWILVIRQLFRRGEKGLAWGFIIVNVLIYCAISWAAMFRQVPWIKLLLWDHGANLLWLASGWGFQRYHLGPAAPRYRPFAWKTRLSPFFTALLISGCFGVFCSIFPIMRIWGEMAASGDILDKRLLLEQFFLYVPSMLVYGLLVGIYWAGEPKKFTAAQPVAFLGGLLLFYGTLAVVFQLFLFIFYGGNFYLSMIPWPAISGDPGKIGDMLLSIQQGDHVGEVVVGLLLCGAVSLRDFWKRSFAFIPLICLAVLPLSFLSAGLWQSIQGQFIHQMTSPDFAVREKGAAWAQTLLTRYPQHDHWPEIALQVAEIRYEAGEHVAAGQLYESVVQQYENKARWRRQVALALAALDSQDYGRSDQRKEIELPPVGYEPYLSPNWMALLQMVRYWSGKEVTESQILIELKALSKSDEEISIDHIPDVAKLHDNAAQLGLDCWLIPTSLTSARALIAADIPFILPIDREFHLVSGYLEDRATFKAYGYQRISARLKKSDKEEAGEILFFKGEGKGNSEKLLAETARQASGEIPFSYYQTPEQLDKSPYMALIFPPEKGEEIAEVLQASGEQLRRQSKEVLGGYIALTAFQSADFIRSIQWARAASAYTEDPFPLHVAHLAKTLWESRDKSSVTSFELQKQFPELAAINEYMDSEEVVSFLARATARFNADLAAQHLSRPIRRHYGEFLDRSTPEDLDTLIALYRHDLEIDPSERQTWLALVEALEWCEAPDQMVEALRGALDAGAWNDEIALRLLYAMLLHGEQGDAATKLFARISPANMKFNAHYFYCKGALAKLEGDTDTALTFYEKAISMRRYIPLYHLEYGKLLVQIGRKEEARKALQWAISIDDGVSVQKEAEKYLAEINQS